MKSITKLRKLILAKNVKAMTDKEHKSIRINIYKPVK
jgi:hypothetical protein